MQQDPVLLFLDNQESHCSLHAVFARHNGIVMVTCPRHCAHRQQPLDVAVMGTFKAKYTATENEWMMDDANPGKESISMNSQVELCMHIQFRLL
jgi:dissimilatory sulfite reductase (desulfoviridin) alpha/beta subunit